LVNLYKIIHIWKLQFIEFFAQIDVFF
jgi:hypothetical protein